MYGRPVNLARERAVTAVLSRHIDRALEGCLCGRELWILWAEGAAYLASTLAEEVGPHDERAAARFRHVSGTLQGAARSPTHAALPLLKAANAEMDAA